MPTDKEHALVWCEIPVSNLADAMDFYATTMNWELKLDESGPNPVAYFPMTETSIAGHLYPGKPGGGAGSTVHLAVSDTAEATAARAVAAGGTRVAGPITIPPGQFIYILDPDGNSIGLFEAA